MARTLIIGRISDSSTFFDNTSFYGKPGIHYLPKFSHQTLVEMIAMG